MESSKPASKSSTKKTPAKSLSSTLKDLAGSKKK